MIKLAGQENAMVALPVDAGIGDIFFAKLQASRVVSARTAEPPLDPQAVIRSGIAMTSTGHGRNAVIR